MHAQDAGSEGDIEDFEGLRAALSWQPDPVEVDLAGGSERERAGADIIGMLVSIYGSKELFINEYRRGTPLSSHARMPLWCAVRS